MSDMVKPPWAGRPVRKLLNVAASIKPGAILSELSIIAVTRLTKTRFLLIRTKLINARIPGGIIAPVLITRRVRGFLFPLPFAMFMPFRQGVIG